TVVEIALFAGLADIFPMLRRTGGVLAIVRGAAVDAVGVLIRPSQRHTLVLGRRAGQDGRVETLAFDPQVTRDTKGQRRAGAGVLSAGPGVFVIPAIHVTRHVDLPDLGQTFHAVARFASLGKGREHDAHEQ